MDDDVDGQLKIQLIYIHVVLNKFLDRQTAETKLVPGSSSQTGNVSLFSFLRIIDQILALSILLNNMEVEM